MGLSQLLEIIKQLIDMIKAGVLLKQKKDLKDAKDEALQEGDQRKLEEALGGSSGPVAPDKYPGLHTRPRKKIKK